MSGIIQLENMAGAFLRRAGQVLLMKRAPNRKIAPSLWSCIGGHTEPQEVNDPLTTCLREIREETGITPEHIFDLRLRYVILRRTGDTLRQSYIYFGETDTAQVTGNGEGTLHWIPETHLADREYSKTHAAMIRHYLDTPEPSRVIVGVAGCEGGALQMHWSAVEDFD